jgi:hypothetical protein
MPENAVISKENVTLLEILDRVLDKGVTITGDITISIADKAISAYSSTLKLTLLFFYRNHYSRFTHQGHLIMSCAHRQSAQEGALV